MKVEQNKETFKPITITLETKDEADYLWHLLNVSSPFVNYSKKKEADKLAGKIDNDMFEAFNDVHEVN